MHFIVVLLMLNLHLAGAQELLPVTLSPSPFATQAAFTEMLQPTPGRPMRVTDLVVKGIPMGTHVRILYTSTYPLPVELGVRNAPPHTMVTGVLPKAVDGDVLLPITHSSFWHPWREGVEVRVYWRDGEPPEIRDIQTAHIASGGKQFLAVLGHPFHGEPFGTSSVNYLYGERIGGIAITEILGGGFLLYCIIAVMSRKRLHRTVWMVGLTLLLLYGGWFTLDLWRQEIRTQRAWWWGRSMGELGHLATMAEFLRGEMRDRSEASVASCTRHTTPLAYFLHPIPVVTRPNDIAQAKWGVFDRVWDEGQAIFLCQGKERDGFVRRRYHNGDAVVEFSPPT